MSKIITPEAVLSYPHVYSPDNNGKYSVALVFLEDADISGLKKAAIEVAAEKYGEGKAAEMIRKKQLRWPFREGVEKDYPEGSSFINARSDRQPGVVSRIPDPKTGKPMAITDPEEIYPGAVVRASLTPFVYEHPEGGKGISFALNNLQKLRDGERLDGRVKAEDEFEADESAAAELDDLTDESAQEDEVPAKKGRAAKRELAGVGAGGDELADLLK